MKYNVTFVALVASIGGLLFGYDTAVISGALGYLKGYFQLNPTQEGFAVSSALIGCAVGALVSGVVANLLGRRKSLIFSAIAYLGSALGSAMAPSFSAFILYRMLGGLGIGVSSVVPVYIAEIAPPSKRGQLNSLYQLNITFGILVVYFVNYLINNSSPGDEWNLTMSWRWMLGSEVIPAVIFLALLLFIPESPRWLVGKNRVDDAQRVLTQLQHQQVDAELKDIVDDFQQERHKNVTIAHIFQHPIAKIVLFIGVAMACLQQLVGINVIIYYATSLFGRISPDADPFFYSVLVGLVNFLSTFIAVKYVDVWGRRKMLVFGSLVIFLIMITLGVALFANLVGSWMIVLILGYIVTFACTLGPIVWIYIAEIAPNQVRGLIVAVSIMMLWVANIAVSQTFPILNDSPTLQALFNGSAPFFFYGIFAFLFLLLARWIPETKTRSLEQLTTELEERFASK